MSEMGSTQRFIGTGLMTVGGLIMSLAGLCTALALTTLGGSGALASLAIGAAPFAFGFLLFVAGRALRNGRPIPSSPPTDRSDDEGA